MNISNIQPILKKRGKNIIRIQSRVYILTIVLIKMYTKSGKKEYNEIFNNKNDKIEGKKIQRKPRDEYQTGDLTIIF